MSKARVLLAEDHVLVSEGLTKLLEDDFCLVGTVVDGRALIQAVQKLSPDIAIIDISLPLLNGLEAARQIKKCEPQTKIVFLTMHAEDEYIKEAFQTGASGYILKSSATAELVFALHEVHRGNTYISPSIAQTVLAQSLSTVASPSKNREINRKDLTPRQMEVLQLIAEGKSNKDIAVILSLAVKTVEFHKSRIMLELSLKTTSELTKYAISHGIISVE